MTQLLPKKMPFKCVVCSGFGTLKSGTLKCHGCGGKGWVIVDQDEEVERKIGEDINVLIETGDNNAKQQE